MATLQRQLIKQNVQEYLIILALTADKGGIYQLTVVTIIKTCFLGSTTTRQCGLKEESRRSRQDSTQVKNYKYKCYANPQSHYSELKDYPVKDNNHSEILKR